MTGRKGEEVGRSAQIWKSVGGTAIGVGRLRSSITARVRSITRFCAVSPTGPLGIGRCTCEKFAPVRGSISARRVHRNDLQGGGAVAPEERGSAAGGVCLPVGAAGGVRGGGRLGREGVGG